MKWKWVEWSALSLVVITVVLGALGYVYEQRAAEADREALSIPGRIVPVDGFGMHLHCTGVGSPTVVLESGTVGFSQSWVRVQGRLAETTRVCSYDRAGLGWSEDWGGHDGRTVAHNLRALLHAGGEAGPFVVVGHSLGASFARIFAGAYRDEVVGLAMLDPTHPDQADRFGPEIRADQQDFRRMMGIASKLALFGVLRAFDFVRSFDVIRDFDLLRDFDAVRGEGPPKHHASEGLETSGAPAVEFFLSSPGHLTAAHAELVAWEETMAAARRVDDLGEVSLVVLSSTVGAEGMPDGFLEISHQMHRELSTLSRDGRHVFLPGADHSSLLMNQDHADQVATHLRTLVAELRWVGDRATE